MVPRPRTGRPNTKYSLIGTLRARPRRGSVSHGSASAIHRTPEQAATIRALLVESIGSAWWAMCCTGMGPDEFFGGKWRYEDRRLHVLGTKRAARDRYVPVVETIERSPLTQEQFQRALKRSGLGVRPYDARRTFPHWCDRAGVPEIRRELYLGHAVRANLRTLYGAHESERFVEEDATRLKKVVGFVVGPAPRRLRKSYGPTRNRTENLLIKSQLLCQLSYRPVPTPPRGIEPLFPP